MRFQHLIETHLKRCCGHAWESALVFALSITLLGPRNSAEATVIVPTTDQHLIEQAAAIVLGRTMKIEGQWDGAKGQIYTYITVQIEEVLKGDLSETEITIKQTGGTVQAVHSWIYGSPEFLVGERVLLFLTINPDLTLRVLSLHQGKFSIVIDPQTGNEAAYRSTAAPGVRILNRAAAAQNAMRPLGKLKADIAAQVASQKGAPVNRAAIVKPAVTGIVETHDQFTFLGTPSRWFEPDSNIPVSVFINSQGQAGAPGQAFEQIRAAYQAWSTVIGSSFRYNDAGFTSAQGFSLDGVNAISFGDPQGILDTPQNCSGTLATGGYFRSTNETRSVNGQSFFRILEGDVVFNDGWQGCGFYESFDNFAEVATHELGHVLGLGHSQDANATMFAFAHFDDRSAGLQSDDAAGVNFIYPKSISIPQIQYADVNGDGLIDSLNFDVSGGAGIWVSLSSASDSTIPQLWLQHGPSTPDQIQYDDVNGDGKADALYFDTSRSNGIWVSLSTGTDFSDPELWLQHGTSTPDQIQYADVNGDGKADALYFDTSRSRAVWVSLSTGSSFATPQLWVQYGSSTPDQIQYVDVNADGKADAVYFETGGALRVSLSTGSGFTVPELWLQHGPSTLKQMQYADVNGDGKADALYFDTSRSNGVWVSLSTGTAFTQPTLWLQHGPSTPEQIQYADVNGDGKADALYFDTSRSNGVWVSLSTGTGFTSATLWLQHGPSTPGQIQYPDVNGDGKADAVYFDVTRSKSLWLSLSTGGNFSSGFLWLP